MTGARRAHRPMPAGPACRASPPCSVRSPTPVPPSRPADARGAPRPAGALRAPWRPSQGRWSASWRRGARPPRAGHQGRAWAPRRARRLVHVSLRVQWRVRLSHAVPAGVVGMDDCLTGASRAHQLAAIPSRQPEPAGWGVLGRGIRQSARSAEQQGHHAPAAGLGTWMPGTRAGLRPRATPRAACGTRARSATGCWCARATPARQALCARAVAHPLGLADHLSRASSEAPTGSLPLLRCSTLAANGLCLGCSAGAAAAPQTTRAQPRQARLGLQLQSCCLLCTARRGLAAATGARPGRQPAAAPAPHRRASAAPGSCRWPRRARGKASVGTPGGALPRAGEPYRAVGAGAAGVWAAVCDAAARQGGRRGARAAPRLGQPAAPVRQL